jgi:3-deoxy-manno-octulosonate cytidylyltransferase (CMP-KDO synthetase)
MKIAIIIPARYNSKRLPKKPLLKINNITLVLHTYLRATKALNKKDIYITSDSKKVLDEFEGITNNTILIKKNCLNGTERCSHAVEKIKKNYDYFLILSCDMPFLDIGALNYLLKNINNSKKNYDAFTLHTSIQGIKTLKDKSIAKVVVNLNNEILYISRSPIPTFKNIKNKPNQVKGKKDLYSHHGLVAIKKNILRKYKNLKNTKLQLHEDNEWLKIIEHGFKIKSIYSKKISPEINTKSDLKKSLNKIYTK